MQLSPTEPRKEQELKPEPIDPLSDAPPVELPGDLVDAPNVWGVKKPARGGMRDFILDNY